MNEALKNALTGGGIALLIVGGIGTLAHLGEQYREGQVLYNEEQPVTGYLDSTNLGFTEAHFYLVNTPDGPVECIVTESPEHGAGAGISCNWEEAP